VQENAGVSRQREVFEPQTREFRYAQRGGETQVQHRTVPDTRPIDWPGCIEKRLDLFCGEMPHQMRVALLHRDDEDTPDLLQGRRNTILHEVHEGFDGCQTHIAGAGAVGAYRLQMVEETDDQRFIDLFQLQSRWCDLQLLACVVQGQFEGVSVGVAGIHARRAFEGETFLKERGHVWGKRSHGAPPTTWASQRSAILRMSSGTASRYQYVYAALLCPKKVESISMCWVIWSRLSGQASNARTAKACLSECGVGRRRPLPCGRPIFATTFRNAKSTSTSSSGLRRSEIKT